MSGKIVELLVEEDSTVTVGQDLLRIEPGEGGTPEKDEAPKAAPEGGARSEPKNPEEGNKDDPAPASHKEKGAGEGALKKQSEKAPGLESSKQEKPAPKKESSAPAPKKEEKSAPKGKEESGAKAVGTRGETRVSGTSASVESAYARSKCPECDRPLRSD